jgi:hypothetical protein
MRLPHRFAIIRLIVVVARSVSGHRQCGITQERDEGATDGQAHQNRRLDHSLIEIRNHSVCQFCPGVET